MGEGRGSAVYFLKLGRDFLNFLMGREPVSLNFLMMLTAVVFLRLS